MNEMQFNDKQLSSMKNLDECIPKTAEERLMLLLGRLKAFEGYVNATEYSIDKKTVAGMLGFEISKKCEEKVE